MSFTSWNFRFLSQKNGDRREKPGTDCHSRWRHYGRGTSFKGNDCIGVTTSGGFGHFVQKSLGFGYVDPANGEPGTELGRDLLGDRCRVTVLKDPAYDPANERMSVDTPAPTL